jgi:hypothetical protein
MEYESIEPIPCSDYIQAEFTAVQTPPRRLKEIHFLEHILRTGKKTKTSQKMCVVHKMGQRKETQQWGSVVFTRMLQGVSYTPQFLNHLLPLLRYRALIL